MNASTSATGLQYSDAVPGAHVYFVPGPKFSGNRLWDAARRSWWLLFFRRKSKDVAFYGTAIGVGSFVGSDGKQSVALFYGDTMRCKLTANGAREIATNLTRWADVVDENNRKQTFGAPEKVILRYLVEAIADAKQDGEARDGSPSTEGDQHSQARSKSQSPNSKATGAA